MQYSRTSSWAGGGTRPSDVARRGAARRGKWCQVRRVVRRRRRRRAAWPARRRASIISSEPWEARRAAPRGGGQCAARAPRMLRLHYFSDNPALAVDDNEESVYSIDLIKEFEAVGRAWKSFLADWLLKGAGLFMSPTLLGRF
ncbi:unnamed protein product [Chrysodeixis includens]|uniref:Uncharacterized protein n=1 Tax=Chrysodeixis includens TaxID=689277 RepID=A0A9N8KX16_CHRIL|nr:unnamed protein product [Chrysodeixis includens]